MTRPNFEEPPDDMALRAGALLVNWNGNAGVAAPEVSSAFRVAGSLQMARSSASSRKNSGKVPYKLSRNCAALIGLPSALQKVVAIMC